MTGDATEIVQKQEAVILVVFVKCHVLNSVGRCQVVLDPCDSSSRLGLFFLLDDDVVSSLHRCSVVIASGLSRRLAAAVAYYRLQRH